MTIDLERLDDAFHFRAVNEAGHAIDLDASAEAGGQGAGYRPMQLVAAGLGGCSSIDVVTILKKQRQPLDGYRVRVEARRADGVPAVFEAIHLTFELEGALDPDKAQRAVELSLGTYCSVAKMMAPTVALTYTLVVNGTTHTSTAA